MFVYLLIGLAVAAAIHASRLENPSRERVGEILLLYLLIGYCGGPGVILSVMSLLNGPLVAATLGFPPDNPFQDFLGYAYLGMSVITLLALRYRGTYLVGPSLLWAIFFAGATFVHLGNSHGGGALSHGSLLVIFVSHGLISILVLVTLYMSGAATPTPPPTSSG